MENTIEIFDESKFNIEKDYSVDASAGTGKTYSIKKMAAKLLLNDKDLKNDDGSYKIEKILLVTYTEKAVGELRDRIRAELEKQGINANMANADIVTIHSFCQNTIKQFPIETGSPMGLSVVSDELLGDLFDRFLREKLYKKEIPACKGKSVNNSKKQILKLSKLLYLKKDGTFDTSMSEVMIPSDCFVYDLLWRVGFCSTVNEVYQVFTTAPANSPFKNAYDSLKHDMEKIVKEIVDNIHLIFANNNNTAIPRIFNETDTPEDLYNKTQQINSQIKAKTCKPSKEDKERFNAAEKAARFLYEILSRTLEEGEIKYNGNKFRKDYVDAFGFKKIPFIKEQKGNAMYHHKLLAEELCREWHKLKQEHRWQNFDDMIRGVREAVIETPDTPAIVEKLREKYKYAIIDEFQDTNQLQWDIFKRVFLDSKTNYLIVVGDPKQSIYSFQGADKHVYDAAIREMKNNGKQQFRLNKNHRSSKELVDGYNNIFNTSVFKTSLDYQDVESLDEGEKGFRRLMEWNDETQKYEVSKGITLIVDKITEIKEEDSSDDTFDDAEDPVDEKDGDELLEALLEKLDFMPKNENSLVESEADIEDEEDDDSEDNDEDTKAEVTYDLGELNINSYAAYVASYIANSCEKVDKHTRLCFFEEDGEVHDDSFDPLKDISFSDFTILVRKRDEAMVYRRALEKLGIPCALVKDTSLFSGIENAHWICLLEALIQPDFTNENRSYYKKLMFTKFFGYTLDDIARPYFDRDDTKEMKLVQSWIQLANAYKYDELIDSVINDSEIEQRLSSLSDINSLAVFKQLGEYCLGYLLDHHTIAELIDNLGQSGELDDSEDDAANIIAKNTDFDSVRIMTIHASKGLDAPIIILGSYSNPARDTVGTCYLEDEADDVQKEASLSDDSDENNSNKTMVFKKYITNDDELLADEYLNEEKRLYYVAMTRAMYGMLIPATIGLTESVILALIEQNPDLYNWVELENRFPSRNELEQLKAKVKATLNRVRHKSEGTKTLDSQLEDMKDMIKEKKSKTTFKHSYTSLSHEHEEKSQVVDDKLHFDKEGKPAKESLEKYDTNSKQIACDYDSAFTPIAEPEDFPKGTTIGTTLHEVFEKFDFKRLGDDELLKGIIKDCFKNNGYSLKDDNQKHQSYIKYVMDMVKNVLKAKLPEIHGTDSTGEAFTLCSIDSKDRKAETEFNFNILYDSDNNEAPMRNYCNGFIDLLFRKGDYYSILDWKSDKKKEPEEDSKVKVFSSYSDAKILKQHVDDEYSIQRVLYSYCLIKWLKNFYPDLSEEEIFKNHFGGIYYVFLRGCNENKGNGIYAQTWDSYDKLKKAFNSITKCKMGGFHNDK